MTASKTRVLFLLLSLLAAVPSIAQNGEVRRWTVVRNGGDAGSAPVQMVGEEAFVDALSLSDALQIDYYRDEEERYVFSFPELPVVFAELVPYVRVGIELAHFPIGVYKDGLRLYVPEDLFLDLVDRYTPGEVIVDRDTYRIFHTPPSSDILAVNASFTSGEEDQGGEVVWRFVGARTLGASLELVDSLRVALVTTGAVLPTSPLPVSGDSTTAGKLEWRAESKRVILTAPERIKLARLEGPDEGNVLTMRVSLLGNEEGPAPRMAYGDKTIDETLAADRERWRIDSIVIDPGHGGRDPGAIGRGRTREKDIVLDIALKLRDELKKQAGDVDVVMTRDRDVFIPLGERTRIANAAGGKLFISIHCNANRDRRAKGQETYFLSPARTERAMQVALKENAVVQYEQQRQDYPDLTDERFILLTMAQAQFVKESESFASKIQLHGTNKTGLRNRGVDQAGFYVLIGASMPAVLVETAFISNPNEEKLLKDNRFRKKIATGICDAVLEFMQQNGE